MSHSSPLTRSRPSSTLPLTFRRSPLIGEDPFFPNPPPNPASFQTLVVANVSISVQSPAHHFAVMKVIVGVFIAIATLVLLSVLVEVLPSSPLWTVFSEIKEAYQQVESPDQSFCVSGCWIGRAGGPTLPFYNRAPSPSHKVVCWQRYRAEPANPRNILRAPSVGGALDQILYVLLLLKFLENGKLSATSWGTAPWSSNSGIHWSISKFFSSFAHAV
ncbi:hypothetical protein J5N97_019094 [Dioscorea zingiberensis]|uniref:Uncharacterized protein n=1 Tax=Dioscorea zingiberensis TaxID=325984 RepID=A0A9D5CE37_9LILI|nr:hypothetical protein J5N97_019094 [Dioscorea zingiberensis]